MGPAFRDARPIRASVPLVTNWAASNEDTICIELFEKTVPNQVWDRVIEADTKAQKAWKEMDAAKASAKANGGGKGKAKSSGKGKGKPAQGKGTLNEPPPQYALNRYIMDVASLLKPKGMTLPESCKVYSARVVGDEGSRVASGLITLPSEQIVYLRRISGNNAVSVRRHRDKGGLKLAQELIDEDRIDLPVGTTIEEARVIRDSTPGQQGIGFKHGGTAFMVRVTKANSDEAWRKIQNREAPGRKEFIIARLPWAMRKEHLQDIVNQIGWRGAEVGFLKDPNGNRKDKTGFVRAHGLPPHDEILIEGRMKVIQEKTPKDVAVKTPETWESLTIAKTKGKSKKNKGAKLWTDKNETDKSLAGFMRAPDLEDVINGVDVNMTQAGSWLGSAQRRAPPPEERTWSEVTSRGRPQHQGKGAGKKAPPKGPEGGGKGAGPSVNLKPERPSQGEGPVQSPVRGEQHQTQGAGESRDEGQPQPRPSSVPQGAEAEVDANLDDISSVSMDGGSRDVQEMTMDVHNALGNDDLSRKEVMGVLRLLLGRAKDGIDVSELLKDVVGSEDAHQMTFDPEVGDGLEYQDEEEGHGEEHQGEEYPYWNGPDDWGEDHGGHDGGYDDHDEESRDRSRSPPR